MPASICFVGDINFGRGIAELDDAALANLLGRSVSDRLTGELVTGNLECILGDLDTPNPLSHANFKTPFRSGVDDILKKFHVLSFANNHLYDFCDEGVASTLAHCKRLGVTVVGVGAILEEAYKPALLQLSSGKVAVFGCTTVSTLAKSSAYYAAEPNDRMFESIALAVEQGYTAIVHCHAGGGDFEQPAPYIKTLHEQLVAAGAKLVIGHHPHVVQGWMTGANSCFFSMGDFIFDKFEDTRDVSILVNASLDDGVISEFQVFPVKRSQAGFQLQLMKDEKLNAFNHYAKELNGSLMDGRSDEQYIQWYGNPLKRQLVNLKVEFEKTGFSGIYGKLTSLNLRKIKSVLEVLKK